MIIFLHMPKTGGQSVLSLLESIYGPERVWKNINNKESMWSFLATPRDDDIRALHGHMPHGIHRLMGIDAKYIVFLRDPVDRYVSDYYFIRNNKSHQEHDALVNARMSLIDFARNTSLISPIMCRSAQTRRLQCVNLHDEWWPPTSIREDGAVVPAELNDRHLERAKEMLRSHIDFIGIYEQMYETIQRLRDMLSVESVALPWNNQSPGRRSVDELSSEERAEILALNKLDVELYEYAQELFWNARVKHRL